MILNADSWQAVHSSERSDDGSQSRSSFRGDVGTSYRLFCSSYPTEYACGRDLGVQGSVGNAFAAFSMAPARSTGRHGFPLPRLTSGSRIVGPFKVSRCAAMDHPVADRIRDARLVYGRVSGSVDTPNRPLIDS